MGGKKFWIGEQFISTEGNSVVLVQLEGTPDDCTPQVVRQLSSPITDPEALRQKAKALSASLDIPWDFRIVPNKSIPSWRVKGGKERPSPNIGSQYTRPRSA
jgi:hypothetical protein